MKAKIIPIIFIILIIGTVAFWAMKSYEVQPRKSFLASLNLRNLGESPVEPPGVTTEGTFQNPTPSSVPFSANVANNNLQVFTRSTLGFSFKYPLGVNVSSFVEGEAGETILVQKSGTKESFQIFISEFDESGPITPARVKKDIPDMVIENPQEVLIGEGKKILALIFFSQSESLGRTREVWFVANGSLYQLTTYADMDNFIGPILDTLNFR